MSDDPPEPDAGDDPTAEADPTDVEPSEAGEEVEPPETGGDAERSETGKDGEPSSGTDREGVDGDPEFRDLHPVTALLNALQWGFNAGVLGFVLGVGAEAVNLLPSTAGFVLAPVGLLLGAGYGVADYLVFEYRLGGSALYITSGVFRRQNREIPLRRIQNVDVHQTFVARLLGLSAVRLETAGGGQTEAELRLVTRGEADRLQREVRRRKRSADVPDRRGGEPAAAGRPEESGTVLFELSMGDLLVLSGVSFRWSVLFLFLFGIPLVSDALVSVAVEVVGDGTMAPDDPLVVALAVGGVVGLLLASWLVSAALTFVRYFDFRLARIDDELVYERGLLQRYSGSIPLDKVQTLTIRDNPLMRRLGYAALLVETAGYTPGGDRGDGQQVPSAVPLAAREDVEAFATDLEGVESFDVERPPRRARNRYAIRYGLVVAALTGVLFAVDWFVLGLPWYVAPVGLVLAPVAGHLKWTHRGFAVGGNHLVTRTGFWRRSTQLVPYYRIQTVVTERTYFQRRWRIASVVADTASSSALLSRHPTAYDVDEDHGRRLHETLRERLRESLRERRAGQSATGDAAGRDDPPADDG